METLHELNKPVAWAYLFDDDGSLCQTFDTQDEAEKWAGSDDNLWSGYIAPLFTAPQAQQPAPEINQCDGCRSGQEMRGSLHIDRDGKATMVCQANKYQQPRKAVKLTDEEIDACYEVARKSFRHSQSRVRGQQLMSSDAFDWHFARAIEQAVLKKNGVGA